MCRSDRPKIVFPICKAVLEAPRNEEAPLQYQFLHVEAHAQKGAHKRRSRLRKPSMSDIMDEMIRAPHACPHVAHPEEPNVVFGSCPEQAFALAAERAGMAVDPIGRRLRCDAPVVLVGVLSWPDLVSIIKVDPVKQAVYQSWRAATIQWLKEQWDGLECVVEHLDEPRPHLHFVVVPKLERDRRLRIESVHPGHRAAAECKKAGGSRREQKNAYIDAMVDLQEAYYESVSVRFGLTRLGPRRQRLTRKEWLQRQRQADAQARALAKAHASLDAKLKKIATRATQLVTERVAHANTEAQKKIETAEQNAREKISLLQQETAKLQREVAEQDKIIRAQQEQLQSLMSTLAEHGLDQRMVR
jgi:hypothetical protein